MFKKALVSISLSIILLIVSSGGLYAQGGNLTNEQLSKISQRCQQIQPRLNTIKQKETAARYNRGKLYEQLIRQADAFASRMDANSRDSSVIRSRVTGIDNDFISFKNNFDSYLKSLDFAIASNCEANPRDFYGWLLKVINDKKSIAEDVKSINKSIEDYKGSLKDIKISLEAE